LLEGPPQDFPLRTPRPAIERIAVEALGAERPPQPQAPPAHRPTAESHRKFGVRSVIDVHLWNQTKWRGVAFAQNAPGYPPFLALIFEDDEAATKIFTRWRERIGPYDEQDGIRLSVIRHLPGHSPFHYSVQLSANPLPGELETGQVIAFITRSMVVEPASDENLENFLSDYRQYGAYYLIPAIWHEGLAEPELRWDLPVLKRQLNVLEAAAVTNQQIEWLALREADESR
jgi:hypothetical protein